MTRSEGHIAFIPRVSGGMFEYFSRQGQIWRMDTNAPIMPDGYRCGRWYGPDRADIREQLHKAAA